MKFIPRRQRNWVRVAAPVAALGLLLAACGGSDDSDDTGAPSAGGPAPAGAPIKLMVIAQLTATNQTVTGEAVAAAKAAAASVNAKGGILGRPLEIVACDDKFDANTAAACARQAASSGVVATVGNISAMGDTYNPLLNTARIASISPYAISQSDFTSPNSFPLIAGGAAGGAGAARALVRDGAKTIGLAYIDSAAGDNGKKFFELGIVGTGAQTGQSVPVPVGAPDVAPAAAAASKGADGVVVALQPSDTLNFVQTARRTGVDAKFATVNIDPKLLEKLGSAGDGMYLVSYFAPLSSSAPGIAAYQTDIKQYGEDVKLSDYAVNAWAGVQAFVKMVEQQKLTTIDAPSVMEGMSKVVNLDLGGVIPPYSTNAPSKVPGMSRIFNPYVQITVVKNGKVVETDGQWIDPMAPPAG